MMYVLNEIIISFLDLRGSDSSLAILTEYSPEDPKLGQTGGAVSLLNPLYRWLH